MYHQKQIITGLVIFVLLLTFPFWYSLGQASYETPELMLPEDEEQCIEATDWMRANHMELLDEWRDTSVREKKPIYVNSEGQTMEISLQKTCMECHTNMDRFCGACHDAAAVDPYCWDCHIAPEEVPNG
ncbi:MAG: sulfate reduction electron transfer complex DsrMKJOP subunit DsrJ [Desulfohalobiaceae bacterium]|nr:sulfate reduction electron transfer complex DsrMKJOP subunit DsrJ [Desulfohalobiaceae bacterium]